MVIISWWGTLDSAVTLGEGAGVHVQMSPCVSVWPDLGGTHKGPRGVHLVPGGTRHSVEKERVEGGVALWANLMGYPKIRRRTQFYSVQNASK